MIQKKAGVFLGSLFLMVFLLGVVSGQNACWIETGGETACENALDGQVVMGLSSSTNAHGELKINNVLLTYPVVLCCNFGNGVQADCPPSEDTILFLSSTTNAHAEIPEAEGTTYTTEICYADMACVSTNPPETHNAILSLSDTTNAHIGGPNDYDTKIWCNIEYTGTFCGDGNVDSPNDLETGGPLNDGFEDCDDGNNIDDDACSNNCVWTYAILEPNPHWAANEQTQLDFDSHPAVIVGTTEVVMNFENAASIVGVDVGDSVKFEIYENDPFPFPDDDIRVGEDAIIGIVRADGDAIANWTITNSDLDKTNDDDEFYFETNISDLKSNFLDLTISQILGCGFINLCIDYGPVSCEKDAALCQVADFNVMLNNPTIICGGDITCECWWDATANGGLGSCNSRWGDGTGWCEYGENITEDCDVGGSMFLTYIFTADWVVGGVSEGEVEPDCVGGSNVVPCPAQIQLPFINIYNIIAIIVVIVLIYFLLNQKKKKRKRKVSKKKK